MGASPALRHAARRPRRYAITHATPTIAAIVLATILAACGAPPPPEPEPDPEPTVLEGVYIGDAASLPMAVALLALDETVLPAVADGGVAPGAVELVPGVHVVGSGFVGADGEVALELLDGDALPPEVLLPAARAFVGGYGAEVPVGCTIAPDDDAARATAFGVAEIVASFAPSLLGFTPAGTETMVFTSTAVDLGTPDLNAATLITYVYADRPVAFASSSTCADALQDLTVAVDLEAGWNRVAIRLDGLAGSTVAVVFEDDPGTTLRLQPLQ